MSGFRVNFTLPGGTEVATSPPSDSLELAVGCAADLERGNKVTIQGIVGPDGYIVPRPGGIRPAATGEVRSAIATNRRCGPMRGRARLCARHNPSPAKPRSVVVHVEGCGTTVRERSAIQIDCIGGNNWCRLNFKTSAVSFAKNVKISHP